MSRWEERTRVKQEKAARAAEKRRARDRAEAEFRLRMELAKLKDPLKQLELFKRAPKPAPPLENPPRLAARARRDVGAA